MSGVREWRQRRQSRVRFNAFACFSWKKSQGGRRPRPVPPEKSEKMRKNFKKTLDKAKTKCYTNQDPDEKQTKNKQMFGSKEHNTMEETKTAEESKMEDKKVVKSRDFFIRTYLPEKAFREVIGIIGVQHWAYIKHDKEDCEPHFHIVLRLNNPTTASGIQRKLVLKGKGLDDGKDINSIVQVAKCFDECFSYLTHENKPDKVQYPVSAIVTDDFGYFRGKYSSLNNDDTTAPCIENTAYQILHDIENGVDMRTMARRYGREYIINHQAYRNYVDLMRQEEEDRKRCAEFAQRLKAVEEKRYDDFSHMVNMTERAQNLMRWRELDKQLKEDYNNEQ